MNIVGERLKELRVNARYSQKQLAELCETTQATIGRYEMGVAEPPFQKLLWYADFFNVSLDYIFARTDKPQGVIYEFKPKAAPEREEMRRFIEMCFDPQSPMNEKLKETLFRMMEENR